jgi:hypothetical protein
VVSPLKQVARYEESVEVGSTGLPITRRRPLSDGVERKTFVYNHAVATTAMVEAAGLTADPRWLKSAQRALDFVALARNPYFVWRYGIKPGDNDTSVTGWMMLALHTARIINRAAESAKQPALFTVEEEAFDGIRSWIERVTDTEVGRVGYATRGAGPSRLFEAQDRFPEEKSEAMTAVGMLTLLLGGVDRRKHKVLLAGAQLCSGLPPTWAPKDGSIDMIYWHFGTLAIHQMGGCAKGASAAERRRCYAWMEALDRALVDHQRRDGTVAGGRGSWDPVDPWGRAGGRVYATAISALALLTPVRFPLQH